jgi:uncharacterized membrane protein
MAIDISKVFERSPEGYQTITWALYIASCAIAAATLGEFSGTLLLIGCIAVIVLARSRIADAASTIYGSHLQRIAKAMTIALFVAIVLKAITYLTLGIGVIITWPLYLLFLVWLGFTLIRGLIRLNDNQPY